METIALLLTGILCVLIDISNKLGKLNKRLEGEDKRIEKKTP